MKILYISPENTVGTLGLWQRIHRERGHECRYVTYFPSPMGFPEDICLHLPLVRGAPWFVRLRNRIYIRTKGPLGDETLLEGTPPVWQPGSLAERAFFACRDRLWRLYESHFAHRLVLEMDAVPVLCSQTIGQLILLQRRIAAQGGLMRLCGLSETCEDALRLCRLEDSFQNYSSRACAVHGNSPHTPHLPHRPR